MPRGNMLPSASPGRYGSFLAIGLGIAMFALGIAMFFRDASTAPLRVALMIVGVAEVAVGYLSLYRNRVAWSFALSINGTAGVIFLFGAPKVRDAAGIGLGSALVPALILAVVTALLAASYDEFER